MSKTNYCKSQVFEQNRLIVKKELFKGLNVETRTQQKWPTGISLALVKYRSFTYRYILVQRQTPTFVILL